MAVKRKNKGEKTALAIFSPYIVDKMTR